MNLKNEFIAQLQKSYPGLKNQALSDLVSENLISLFTIELPTAVLLQAQEIVSAAFSLREKSQYQEAMAPEIEKLGLKDPGNKSILMSYDFHVDENQNLKLIEINTNASFMLLGTEMYEMKDLPLPVADFSKKEFGEMIQQELQLQGKKISHPSIAIIDEQPSQQRLYAEFLAYDELFKSFGWNSKVCDFRETFSNGEPDFIYNRFTDFLLEGADSQLLREKYLSREVCLSPNPYEYVLLADKQRLIDWNEPGFLEKMDLSVEQISTLKKMLPVSYDLTAANKDELWHNRKHLFFKPKRAFGAKSSYRGASVSRKHFEAFEGQEIIAQGYVPAPEISFETPDGPQNFKYDLRCYAYQGRLQMIVARLYQGQVTNLRTPYGGFGPVVFR